MPACAGAGMTPRKWQWEKQPCVYILASERNGTLYIGVTSDLAKRIWQHRNAGLAGFTSRYSVYQLVWFEICADMSAVIMREKQLKKWNRYVEVAAD